MAGWLKVLGYGWAGLMRKYVVAEHARPGLPLPVSTSFTLVLGYFRFSKTNKLVLCMLPFSVVAFVFLNFSATAFFSLVGFWLTFVVGFSEAGETNTFFGIL